MWYTYSNIKTGECYIMLENIDTRDMVVSLSPDEILYTIGELTDEIRRNYFVYYVQNDTDNVYESELGRFCYCYENSTDGNIVPEDFIHGKSSEEYYKVLLYRQPKLIELRNILVYALLGFPVAENNNEYLLKLLGRDFFHKNIHDLINTFANMVENLSGYKIDLSAFNQTEDNDTSFNTHFMCGCYDALVCEYDTIDNQNFEWLVRTYGKNGFFERYYNTDDWWDSINTSIGENPSEALSDTEYLINRYHNHFDSLMRNFINGFKYTHKFPDFIKNLVADVYAEPNQDKSEKTIVSECLKAIDETTCEMRLLHSFCTIPKFYTKEYAKTILAKYYNDTNNSLLMEQWYQYTVDILIKKHYFKDVWSFEHDGVKILPFTEEKVFSEFECNCLRYIKQLQTLRTNNINQLGVLVHKKILQKYSINWGEEDIDPDEDFVETAKKLAYNGNLFDYVLEQFMYNADDLKDYKEWRKLFYKREELIYKPLGWMWDADAGYDVDFINEEFPDLMRVWTEVVAQNPLTKKSFIKWGKENTEDLENYIAIIGDCFKHRQTKRDVFFTRDSLVPDYDRWYEEEEFENEEDTNPVSQPIQNNTEGIKYIPKHRTNGHPEYRKPNIAADPIKDYKYIEQIKNYFLTTGKSSNRKRNYTIFCLGISTGLRASDLLTLKISDVYDGDKVVDEVFIHEHKTNKLTHSILNNEIKKILEDYIDSLPDEVDIDDYLFPSSSYLGHLQVNSFWYMLNKCASALNLPFHFSTHSLRKTFAYWTIRMHYYDQNIIFSLQDMLNHRDIKNTLYYSGHTKDHLKTLYDDMGKVLTGNVEDTPAISSQEQKINQILDMLSKQLGDNQSTEE